jgi:hypothetical protein
MVRVFNRARLVCLVLLLLAAGVADAAQTLVVTAEGLADPNADTYKRDKGIMIDDLRRDARRQAIEKAVGTLVDSTTLVENYVLIEDRVFSQSKGLIKRIIKESDPWLGDDGFMHLLIKAEVYVGNVRDIIKGLPKLSRTGYIKQYGNPKISVAVMARDAERGSEETRSEIAENILKERISQFGYRVWSEELTQQLKREMMETATLDNRTETTVSISHMKASDFSIYGKAKFDTRSIVLQPSGIKVTKYVLTSWTVKCVDNHTGEEIYFNNKVPRAKSWSSEDEALEDIGRMIGSEFSQEFFEDHLMQPTRIYELHVTGLPDYDFGVMLKKELIGLRPIINVDFRSFSSGGHSLYEVEFAGADNNFAQLINGTVIKPLNAKLEAKAFKLMSVEQGVVKVRFRSDRNPEDLMSDLRSRPPASLATASPERLRQIVKGEEMLEKVAAVNPEAVSKLRDVDTPAGDTFRNVEDF